MAQHQSQMSSDDANPEHNITDLFDQLEQLIKDWCLKSWDIHEIEALKAIYHGDKTEEIRRRLMAIYITTTHLWWEVSAWSALPLEEWLGIPEKHQMVVVRNYNNEQRTAGWGPHCGLASKK